MALGHRVEGGHTDPGRNIGHRLDGKLEGQVLFQALHRVPDVDNIVPDPQMLHKKLCHIDVTLLPAGHQNADHPVLAQGFYTQRRHNGAVLAAGNAHHRVAAPAVFGKEIPDPGYTFFSRFFRVKHR